MIPTEPKPVMIPTKLINQPPQENVIIIQQDPNHGKKTIVTKSREIPNNNQKGSYVNKKVNTDPLVDKNVIGLFLKEICRVPCIEGGNIVFRCDNLAKIVNHFFSLDVDGSWLLTIMQ